ncbi:hypothetical protein EGW26_03335 [Enterococcus faecium]|nr:hypothetical protein EGW26_03335 [Enterococcus faecium]
MLAYCLLVKNVCCLELNQDALHIWFVLLCSVFKGLIFLFQQLFNLIRFRRECQQLFLFIFSKYLYRSLAATCLSYHFICYLSITFLKFVSIKSSFINFLI